MSTYANDVRDQVLGAPWEVAQSYLVDWMDKLVGGLNSANTAAAASGTVPWTQVPISDGVFVPNPGTFTGVVGEYWYAVVNKTFIARIDVQGVTAGNVNQVFPQWPAGVLKSSNSDPTHFQTLGIGTWHSPANATFGALPSGLLLARPSGATGVALFRVDAGSVAAAFPNAALQINITYTLQIA